jgi:hypothetical protein
MDDRHIRLSCSSNVTLGLLAESYRADDETATVRAPQTSMVRTSGRPWGLFVKSMCCRSLLVQVGVY